MRNYVDPHRWSDGTKMAGIARKVGSKDSRFLPFRFHVSLKFSRVFVRSFTSGLDGNREREGSSLVFSPFSREGGKKREDTPFQSRADTKSSGDDPLYFETRVFTSRFHDEWISGAIRIMENWKIWSDWP